MCMHTCGVKITKANVLSSCAITLGPLHISVLESEMDVLHSLVFIALLSLFVLSCCFLKGVLAPIQGPASFPHKSSSNGEHFVRWPDSSLLPLGRRCHPHGTEEQMLVKGKKRGNEMRGRWRGLTSATRETENICLHMQRSSRDETHSNASRRKTYMQPNTCRGKICSTCKGKLTF